MSETIPEDPDRPKETEAEKALKERINELGEENEKLNLSLRSYSETVYSIREENRKLKEQVDAQRQLIQAMELVEETRKRTRFFEVGIKVSILGKISGEVDKVIFGRDGISYDVSWWNETGNHKAVARASEVELLDPEVLPFRQGSITKET